VIYQGLVALLEVTFLNHGGYNGLDFNANTQMKSGSGSSVGIATGYGLDGPGIESRWGARFSAPVQTGPGTNLASCTMGTVSFPGVKERPGRDVEPSPLLVPW